MMHTQYALTYFVQIFNMWKRQDDYDGYNIKVHYHDLIRCANAEHGNSHETQVEPTSYIQSHIEIVE